MYSFCAMYSFRMSFCSVPERRSQSTPCCSATARYMAQITEAGELMVIETVTSPSGMPRKRISMSSSEEMGAPHLPTSPSLIGVVGVVAHQGGQIEGHGKAGLALGEQVVVAAVGLLRRGEAGELPHGPELAAIHVAMNAASVGKLAGVRILKITRAVHRFDGHSADCRKLAFGGFHECLTTTVILAPGCATVRHGILRTKPTCSNPRFFESTTSAAWPMWNCWTPTWSSWAAPSAPTCSAIRASESAWAATRA